MNRKWIGIAAIAAVLIIPVVLKLTSKGQTKEMEVEKVAPHEIRASILASGNLVYQEEAHLSPEVIGKVTQILVKEGDHVEAGQLVMLLDEKTYRAEVSQQEAAVRQQRTSIQHQQVNLENQEAQYRRKAELLDKKYIAPQQFDDARYAVDLAKIDLRTSRESLEQAQAVLSQSNERAAKTRIRAPISGTVTAVDIKVGETAVASQVGIAGSSLMTIANVDTIRTEVNVDEADIAKVKLGQDVEIHTAAFPDKPLKGKVLVIPLSPKRADAAAAGSSLARNYSIKVSLENPDKLLLRPGMTCRAEIFTSVNNNSLSVPIQAVLGDEDEVAPKGKDKKGKAETVKPQNYVFVLDGDVARKHVIKTGISDDSYQEVVEGIKAGDQVVVGPYKLLRHLNDGDHIKIAANTNSSSGAASASVSASAGSSSK